MIGKVIKIENAENICGTELFVKKHVAAVNFFKKEIAEMKKEIAEKEKTIAELKKEKIMLKEEIKKLKT